MAASCISVSVSSAGSLVGGRAVEPVASRQALSRVAFTAPAFAVQKAFFTGFSAFSFGARSVRNAGIAARAADLEEADGITIVEAEGEPQAEPESEADPAPTPAAPAPVVASSKLYVGNLPWGVHSQQLAEIFQDFGNVELVEVIYDRDTQKSRGFAFVTMSTADDAQRAIGGLDGSEIDGRIVKVNFPQTTKDASRNDRYRNERPPPRERRDGEGYAPRSGGSFSSALKIFVGNLSWGVDDVALDELFSEYGKVVEAKVVYDKVSGRSRGFGFVTMTKKGEVDAAIAALDGAEFDGRTLRVNNAGDKPERSDSPRREY